MNNPADTLAALAADIERAGQIAPFILDNTAFAISPSGIDEWVSRLRALASLKGEAEPVAWCQLTPNGGIAYFDGKPMVMVGQVGNYLHPTPLYTAPPAPQAAGEGGRVTSGMICDALGVPRGYALMIAWVEQETGSAHGRWLAHLPAAAEQITAAISTHPTPSPAPQGGGAEEACHQAYQAVGVMLSDLGLFDTERGQNLLDNLSQARVVHEVLPWDSATPPAQQPGEVGEDAKASARILSIIANDPHGAVLLAKLARDELGKVRAFIDAALAPKEKGNG